MKRFIFAALVMVAVPVGAHVYDGDGGGAATPAGANTEIQYNDSGALGASADFRYNGNLVLNQGDISMTTDGEPEMRMFGYNNSTPTDSPHLIFYAAAGTQAVPLQMNVGDRVVHFETVQRSDLPTPGSQITTVFLEVVTENGARSNKLILRTLDVNGVEQEAFTADFQQEVTISKISGDGTGKAVCIKADGSLGTCTDAVVGGGTCTCT